MKESYVEISHIYNFNETYLKLTNNIKRYQLIKSNIPSIKDINYSNYLFAQDKIEKYIFAFKEYTKDKKRENIKNREGELFKIQIPKEFFDRKKVTKKKFNNFIKDTVLKLTGDNDLTEIKDDKKDNKMRSTYIVIKEKTEGYSNYLNILVFDREIYPEGKNIQKNKVAKKNTYLDENNYISDKEHGKLVARKKERYSCTEKIYVSPTKIRFPLIHSRRGTNNNLFNILIKSIREQITIMLKTINKASFKIFTKFKKQTVLNTWKKYGNATRKKEYSYTNFDKIIRRKVFLINDYINKLDLYYSTKQNITEKLINDSAEEIESIEKEWDIEKIESIVMNMHQHLM